MSKSKANFRLTRVHAAAMLTAAAALAGSASPAGSALFTDPQGHTIDVLYTFTGGAKDSGDPFGGVVADKKGNLFGTSASAGGINGQNHCGGYGAVYELRADGKIKGLHAFIGTDGYYPTGSVVLDASGNVFGTTQTGTTSTTQWGSVFEVSPKGVFTTLHFFAGGNDGGIPVAGPIIDQSGNLYGTTAQGGGSGCGNNYGCGTVYKIAPGGAETVLYAFTGGSDGAYPRSGLIMDSSGNLYGTTSTGAGSGCANGTGCGTVFKIAPNGTETTLYTFTGGNDGGNPEAGVIEDSAGNLYGTASAGGADGFGTVFEISADGTESTLHTFAGFGDGAVPLSALVMDDKGNLYGTTNEGGAEFGVVYKLTPKGVETPLYEFQDRGDGQYPFNINGLILYKGYLYGESPYAGDKNACGGTDTNGLGTVFKIKE